MAKSRIEWTEYSWNPITGCTQVSEGCQNCYARRMANRLRGRYGFPADEPFKVTLHPERMEEPLKWRKPRRVFVCSMGDLFHENVPEKFIIDIFSIMAEASKHTFIILTKRPERMKDILTSHTIANDVWVQTSSGVSEEPSMWPLQNVWLGVTAENQARADERIPILLQMPAAVRFISVEPMLGPIYLSGLNCGVYRPWLDFVAYPQNRGLLSWVICGGESGPGARPMHPEWVRSLRDQCQAAGISFFLKSWGEYCFPSQMPEETYQALQDRYNLDVEIPWKVGKKAAGRILDGQIWDEMPEI